MCCCGCGRSYSLHLSNLKSFTGLLDHATDSVVGNKHVRLLELYRLSVPEEKWEKSGNGRFPSTTGLGEVNSVCEGDNIVWFELSAVTSPFFLLLLFVSHLLFQYFPPLFAALIFEDSNLFTFTD